MLFEVHELVNSGLLAVTLIVVAGPRVDELVYTLEHKSYDSQGSEEP